MSRGERKPTDQDGVIGMSAREGGRCEPVDHDAVNGILVPNQCVMGHANPRQRGLNPERPERSKTKGEESEPADHDDVDGIRARR